MSGEAAYVPAQSKDVSMRSAIRRHWLLLVALGLLWLTIAVLLFRSLSRNQGHLVYALDDAYIHMAMAKNLARYGVWGVTRYEFSSSSSSPLWTLLLALVYAIFGVNDASPLLLNILFATLIVIAVYRILSRSQPPLPAATMLFVLMSIIYLTSLPALAFVGMEHTLHTLVTLLFVYLAASVLAQEGPAFPRADAVWLLVLAPFLISSRYEGVFLALVVCLLFWLRGHRGYAAAVGALALLPVGVYGLISTAHGWLWLPNSVILKSGLGNSTGLRLLGISEPRDVLRSLHLLSLAFAILFVYVLRRGKGFWERRQLMMALFLAVTGLHMQFAGVGYFYRYEAYLVALGLLVVAPAALDYVPQGAPKPRSGVRKRAGAGRSARQRYAALIALALTPGLSLGLRGWVAMTLTPWATSNIYEQQMQMGLFLKQFYAGTPVAINDIGAVSYLSDNLPYLDVWGLGSMEVARLKLSRRDTIGPLYDLARAKGVKAAILYERAMAGVRPAQWIEVGRWRIRNNIVAANDTVMIYAVDPREEQNLIAHLKAFAPALPASVEQRGKYTQ